MHFMNQIMSATVSANPMLYVAFSLRMVQISIHYGLCDITAIAFSAYGAWVSPSYCPLVNCTPEVMR